MTLHTAPLENFSPPTQGLPDASALSASMWEQMPRLAPAAGSEPASLNFAAADIYNSGAKTGAPAGLKPVLDKASSINFTTPAQDAKSGKQPDYFMSADGQLQKNPNAKPDPSGKINIELQSKNKTEVDGKKLANQLQKASVKDLITYFKSSHPPGTKIPQDWMDQLSSEPDLPPAPSPLGGGDATPSATTDQPSQPQQPQDAQAQPDATAVNDSSASGASAAAGGGSDGGGGSGGGGGGGGGGGDGGGGSGGGGGDRTVGYVAPSGGAGSDGPVTIPNLPDVANGDTSSVNGNQQLTNSQQQFVEELAKKTGMDANVLGAWVCNEENGDAAKSREGAHNDDWLNVGYTDSGERGTGGDLWHSGPVAAADATAAWMKGDLDVPGFGKADPGITTILESAGKPPGEQIAALQNSPWASSHYPDLPNIYKNLVASNETKPTIETSPSTTTHPTHAAQLA